MSIFSHFSFYVNHMVLIKVLTCRSKEVFDHIEIYISYRMLIAVMVA